MPWTIYLYSREGRACYTGQTENTPKKRALGAGNGYTTQLFGRAIRKYGWTAFKCEVLGVCDTQEDANQMEIEMIKKHKTHVSEGGYNIDWGGRGNGKCSEETKAKMRQANKRRREEKYGAQDGVTKRCGRCKVVKVVAAFAQTKSRYDGLQETCRSCRKIIDKKYAQKRSEYSKTIVAQVTRRMYNRKCSSKKLKRDYKTDEKYNMYKNQLGMLREDKPRYRL